MAPMLSLGECRVTILFFFHTHPKILLPGMRGVPLPPYDVQLLEMTPIARCVAGAHVVCLVASEEGIQDILAKQQQAPHLWRPAVNVWSPELIEQVGELGQEWMKELLRS